MECLYFPFLILTLINTNTNNLQYPPCWKHLELPHFHFSNIVYDVKWCVPMRLLPFCAIDSTFNVKMKNSKIVFHTSLNLLDITNWPGSRWGRGWWRPRIAWVWTDTCSAWTASPAPAAAARWRPCAAALSCPAASAGSLRICFNSIIFAHKYIFEKQYRRIYFRQISQKFLEIFDCFKNGRK